MPILFAEKTKDGVIFCDPLYGKIGIEVEKYFLYELSGKTEFAQVNNLEVTELIRQCIEV